jgi:hypothetical protein
MIHVSRKPAPRDFATKVKLPGLAYLARVPNPTTKQWSAHSYWRNVLLELHNAYCGICAYSCHWIPYDTGVDTVDHFKPKSIAPSLAYAWSNYRLASHMLNGRKGVREDIFDPFTMPANIFIIEFPSLLVKPAKGLNASNHARALATREALGLNDEDTCMKSRFTHIIDYCQQRTYFEYLTRYAPFLAAQMLQNGLTDLSTTQRVMNSYP